MQVHGLGVGDAVGICTNEEGDLVVEANTPRVRQATVRPTYGAAAVHHMPSPPPGKAESFSTGESFLGFDPCSIATLRPITIMHCNPTLHANTTPALEASSQTLPSS